MPPPNQKTGASPALVATSMRTFMCTVGQYGLRGCSTSDTPSASKPRPASCGRAALAEGGSASPETSEKPIPARSKNAAVFEDARAAAAAQALLGPALPRVRGERRAVEGAERVGDAGLQRFQIGA